MSFSETLVFTTDSTVTDPVSLLLTFEKIPSIPPPMDQVAWKVLNFGGPHQTAQATYVASLMVCNAQISSGKLVSASTYQTLAIGQKSLLEPSGQAFKWTTPDVGPDGYLTGINDSNILQNLGVGFLDSSGVANPLLVWQNVGNTNAIEAQFTPVINVYATAQYQETAIIRGEIVSPLLWSQDLALLPNPITDLTLSVDPAGKYSIKVNLTQRPGGHDNHKKHPHGGHKKV